MNIIYGHTSNIDYVRVKKNLEYFDTLDLNITYFGAYRLGQEIKKEYNPYSNIKVLYYKKVLSHGWKSFINFLGYLYCLNKLIRKEKPEVIILTNEELYLALFFLNRKKVTIVIDAIDALDIRVETNSVIKQILNGFVKLVRRKSNTIVEVEEFRKRRFPKYESKTIVIRNTPNVLAQNLKIDNSLVLDYEYIYASGSLNKNINGLETLIEALQIINSKENNKKIGLVIAGIIIGDDLLKKIQNNSFIQYVGSVTLEESQYLASKAKAMFAFYKPDRENFIYAAPNKVYESFMLGKPLLINKECIISELCKSKGNGFLSLYDDALQLSSNINSIEKTDLIELKNDFKSTMCWHIEQKKWDKVLNI